MAKAIQIAAALAMLVAFASPILPSSVQAAPRAHDTIEQIEVTGVTVFGNSDIEAVLEVQPGDPVDPKRVSRTVEALNELYRMRGYEAAHVQAGMRGDVLEFQVDEGNPTRVAQVDFIPDGIDNETFRKYWERLKSTLGPKLGIEVGDLYDQEKVSSGKRSLQDALAIEEYIGARVTHVRVETVPPPEQIPEPLLAKLKDKPARRWVKLEIHLDLGDRVTFGFRGNSAFTVSQLNALIEEQRLLGFGKDYLGAVETRILEEYRAAGYAHAKVTVYTFERNDQGFGGGTRSRHVTFEIDEGPRVRIGEVRFDGNFVFSEKVLRKHFFDRAPTLVQSGYYVEKDVRSAAELLIEWMKSKGYLSAKVVTIDSSYPWLPKFKPARSMVNLKVFLFEGEETVVRGISFKGITVFPAPEVKRMLSIGENQALNPYAFSDGLEQLKNAYRARGYLNARIANEESDQIVTYSNENRSAEIFLNVDEGPQFRASKIFIEGLTKTRERVVRRKLEFEEGDILEDTKIVDSEKNLRRLGLFSTSSIRLADDPEKPGYKIVRVSVQEGTPGVVGGGLGFRNDLGIRVFGQAGYDNLWNDNHSAALSVNANRRLSLPNQNPKYHFVEYQAQASYIYPWFLYREVTFRPVLTVSRTQFVNFDADTRSVALTWERPVLNKPSLIASFTYGLEGIQQFNSVNPIDDQQLLIGSVTPALRIDTRDDPLAPTTGWYSSVSYEIASPFLFSKADIPELTDQNGTLPAVTYPVGFTRFQFRVDRFFTFFDKISLYLSGRTGFERNTVSPLVDPSTGRTDPRTGTIPVIKQFTLGGVSSLRGFKDQELNYQNIAVQGTLSYVNYRTQLDLPFMGALRFGPFLDAGNLQVDTFSFGNLRFGTGAGFHYQTPIGPVNLDWGFKVDPRPGEDPSEIYFSIGII